MLLRWWREEVRYKPLRWALQRLLACGYASVGAVGGGALWLRRRLRRQALPALASLTPRTILVLRPDRVGDVVLATPALQALRARFPQAAITVLTAENMRLLLERHPAITTLVTVPGSRLRDFWRGRDVLRRVRQEQFDVIIVLASLWSCALLGAWLGGAVRLGYDVQGMGFLLTHALPYPYDREKTHQVIVNARLVEALGCEALVARGPLALPLSHAARAAARQWLVQQGMAEAHPVVMLHPGSRSRYTRWEAARFAAVADGLQRARMAHVVLCGPGEDAIVAQMQHAMTHHPPMARGLSLDIVAGLMSWCDLFIGNATGTTHLAAALGPRVVEIIGGTHPLDCPERWGPWGAGHRVVHHPPETVLGRSTEHWVGPEGLRHITPEDVLTVVRELCAAMPLPGPA